MKENGIIPKENIKKQHLMMMNDNKNNNYTFFPMSHFIHTFPFDEL